MAERTCPSCGRTFNPKNGQHRYCSTVCRERGRARVRVLAAPAKYGAVHQRLRRALAREVAQGDVCCVRCGLPIGEHEPWDLDHADDGNGYRGAAHRACNRQTSTHRAAAAVDYENDPRYQDDPARGIYWGPPSEPGGTPRRWSRHWFDWRPEELAR